MSAGTCHKPIIKQSIPERTKYVHMCCNANLSIFFNGFVYFDSFINLVNENRFSLRIIFRLRIFFDYSTKGNPQKKNVVQVWTMSVRGLTPPPLIFKSYGHGETLF